MTQQINLFNPQFLQKEKYFSAVTMAEALGLLVLGIAAFYGYALWQDRDLARQLGESSRALEYQKQQFGKAAAELNPGRFDAQLDEEIAATEAAIALRRALLGEIQIGGGRRDPYSEYLRAFARQTVQGLWLTGIQIAEGSGQLSLNGRALQADLVPVLITRLGREPALKGRQLEALAVTRTAASSDVKRSIVEFIVTSPGTSGVTQGQKP